MKKILFFLMLTLLCIPWATRAQNAQFTLFEGETGRFSNRAIPVWGQYLGYGDCATEFIIPAEFIDFLEGASFTQMRFYVGNTYNPYYQNDYNIFNAQWQVPYKIYMSETEATSFSGRWDTVGRASSTLVASNLLSVNPYDSTLDVIFNISDYEYHGGNLVIGFYEDADINNGQYGGFDNTVPFITADFGSQTVAWIGNTFHDSLWNSYELQTMIPKITFDYYGLPCPKPRDLQVYYNPGSTSAQISWISDASDFEIEINGVVYNFNDASPNSEHYYGINIVPGTEYAVKVKAHCNGQEESGWSLPLAFITAPQCEVTLELTSSDYYSGWSYDAIDVWDNTNYQSLGTFRNENGGTETYTIPISEGQNISFSFQQTNPTYPSQCSWVIIAPTGDTISQGNLDNLAYGSRSDFAQYTGSCSACYITVELNNPGGNNWDGNAIGVSDNAVFLTSITPDENEPIRVLSGHVIDFYWMDGLSGSSPTEPYSWTIRDAGGNIITQGSNDNNLQDGDWLASYTADCSSQAPVVPSSCDITIELTDSYGDGWNGNHLIVKDVQADTTIVELIFNYGSTLTNILTVSNGQKISFVYDASGSDQYENGYVITAADGSTIASHTGGDSNNPPTAGPIATYTVNCGSNPTPANYCQPAPTSVDGEGIVNVSFGTGNNIVNNSTYPTSSPYYGNYSSQIGAVAAGTIATVDITFNTCYNGQSGQTCYNYGTLIWVDWNNSGTFGDNEIVFADQSSPYDNPTDVHTLNATFAISANQATGDYRMRIGAADSYFDEYIEYGQGPHDPCNSEDYVVFHDYTLRVTEAPSCLAPVVTVDSWTSTTVNISWTDNNNGTSSYIVKMGNEVLSGSTTPAVSINGTTATLTGLTSEHYYLPGDFTVTANCDGNDFSAAANVPGFYTGYCQPAPASVDGIGITNVSFGTGNNIVNNSSYPTSAPYYGNYTSQIGAVAVGQTATVDITFNTCYNSQSGQSCYNYGTLIWVDWNNNQAFEDNEIVFEGLSSQENNPAGVHTLNATFAVSPNRATGDYRMRIGAADSYFNDYITYGSGPHSPCYSESYAVFHDYTLRVTEAPTCPPLLSLEVAALNPHIIAATWLHDQNVEPEGYVVRYGIVDNPEQYLHGVTPDGQTCVINNLCSDSLYYIHVRAYCGGNDYSEWTTVSQRTLAGSCSPITNLHVDLTGNGTNSATISWTASESTTADLYDIHVCTAPVRDLSTLENGNCEFPQATRGTSFSIPNNNYPNFVLTPNTTYYVYVRTRCNLNDGNSDWAETTFSTLPPCRQPMNASVHLIRKMLAEISWERGDTNQADNYMLIFADQEMSEQALENAQAHVSNIHDTTYSFSGNYGQTYYIYVANNCGNDGRSAYTYAGSVTFPSLCPPIQNLTASNVTSNSVQLSWNRGEWGEETMWTIERYIVGNWDSPDNTTTVTDSTVTLNGLQPETNYSFRVQANCDATYSSIFSDWVNVTTFPAIDSCFPPTNINIYDITNSTATVSWEYVYGAVPESGWMMFYGTDQQFSDDTYTSISSISMGSPFVIGSLNDPLQPNTTYYVKMLSNCSTPMEHDASVWTDVYSFTTLDGPSCLEVTNLEVIGMDPDAAQITWTSHGNEEYWDLYWSTSPMAPTAQTNPTVGNTNNPRPWLAGLTPGTHYYAYVRARCSDADRSAWSAPLEFTTLEEIPSCRRVTNLEVIGMDPDAVQITWTSNGNEEYWDLYWTTSPEAPTAQTNPTVGNTNNPRPWLPELTPGTHYYAYVRARCSDVDRSVWSDPLEFIIPCPVVTSFPWTENFDSYFVEHIYDRLPECWNYINTSSCAVTFPAICGMQQFSHSANNHLRLDSYIGSDPQDEYAILPRMQNISGLKIQFDARKHIPMGGTVFVGVMTDPADASTFTTIESFAPNTTEYEHYSISFENYTGSGEYIAFMMRGADPINYSLAVCIDDIIVEELPIEPHSITINQVTGGTIYVNVVDNHGNAYSSTTDTIAAYNAWVNLSVEPNAGYTFDDFVVTTASGIPIEIINSGFVMPGEDVIVSATFTQNTYTVSATVDPMNAGSVTGTGTYIYNTEVTLTAIPATGYSFDHWQNISTADNEDTETANPLSFNVTEDVTYKAFFSMIDYELIYMDGEDLFETVTYNYGDVIDPMSDPEKEGYTFTGWNPAEPATMPDSNMTLYAQWAVNSYIIYYISDEDVIRDTLAYGENITPIANPTKEGYVFVGWNPELPTTMPAHDIRAIAQWSLNKYAITYMDGDVILAHDSIAYGAAITPIANPTKEGYTFAGWNPELPQTMPANDVTVNAQWELIPCMAAENLAVTNNSLTATSALITWSSSQDNTFGGVYYENGVLAGSNYQLYQRWNLSGLQPNSNYRVGVFAYCSLNRVSDTVWVEFTTNDTCYPPVSVSISDVTAHSAKLSYAFVAQVPGDILVNLSTDPNFASCVHISTTTSDHPESLILNSYFNNAPLQPNTTYHVRMSSLCDRNADLTSVWSETLSFTTLQEYAVTIDANITNGTVTVSDTAAIEGAVVNLTATPNHGYSFGEWVVTTVNTPAPELVTVTNNSFVMPEGGVNVSATFIPNRYVITYKNGNNIQYQDSVAYGTAIRPITDPTREGYTFTGWVPELPATMPAYDVTVHAQWNINKYVLTYMDGNDMLSQDSVEFGADITPVANPTKEGYTFNGWDPEMPQTMPAEDLSVNAQWQINTYNIVLNQATGGTTVLSIDGSVGTYVSTTANYNALVEITPVPHVGYSVGSVVVTNPDGSVIPTPEGSFIMPANDVTITATYMLNTYTVTTAVNPANAGTVTGAGIYNYGSEVEMRAEAADGYLFSNWTNAQGAVVSTDAIFDFEITNDTAFTANFTVMGVVATPTFSPAEGTYYDAQNVALECATTGATIHYTTDGTTPTDASAIYSTPIALTLGDTTIIKAIAMMENMTNSEMSSATYILLPTYNVTISDFTEHGTVSANVTRAAAGVTVRLTATADEGYHFGEWNVTTATSMVEVASDNSFIMPDDNVTIAATFVANEYTITYMVDNTVYDVDTFAFGTTITLVDNPTKEGYTFAGWNPELPQTMPANDMTVNAQWELIPCMAAENLAVTSGTLTATSALITWSSSQDNTFGGVYYENGVLAGSNNQLYQRWYLSELQPGTNYRVGVFAYCSLDRISDTVWVEFTTNDTCYPPVSVSISDVTAHSALLSYNFGEHVPDNFMFEISSDPDFANPVVVSTSSAYFPNSHTIGGPGFNIQSGTTYFVRMASQCTTYLTSVWSETLSFTTLQEYAVSVDADITNGTISADVTIATAGTVVNLTATPDNGYSFGEWVVTTVNTPAPELVTVTNNSFVMPEGDVNVSATFTPNSYNITLNPGTGGTIVVSIDGMPGIALSTTANYNSVVDIVAVPHVGYSVGGFVVTNADGSVIPTPNDSFIMPANDVTITGTFIPNEHIITYMDDNTVLDVDTFTYGATITPIADPTKEGYTFIGWNPALPTTMPDNDVRATAQWSINRYALTYMDGNVILSQDSVDYGAPITPIADPTKDGYTFTGWNPQLPQTMPANDVTVNALWELIPCMAAENLAVVHGSLTTTAALITWNSNQDNTFGGVYYENGVLAGSSNQLYQRWYLSELQPGTNYRVGVFAYCSLDRVSDTVWVEFTTNDTCYPPVSVSISDVTAHSALLSYDFGEHVPSDFMVHISTDPDFADYDGTSTSTDYYPNSLTIGGPGINIQSGTTYYVKMASQCYPGLTSVWSETLSFTTLQEYAVSVDADITNGTISADVTIATAGTVVNLTATPDNGYSFGEWVVTTVNTPAPDTITVSNNSFVMPASEVNISATFTPNSYNITLNPGTGGTIVVSIDGMPGIALSTTANYNSVVDIVAVPHVGYSVGGFVVTNADGSVIPTPNDSFIMPANDVTITGTFIPNEHIITYMDNNTVLDVDTFTYGATVTPIADPTREGYTFIGWNPTLPTTMPDNDVRATAQWSINRYALTYMDGNVILSQDSVDYGAPITPIADPTKEGYTFTGWNPQLPQTMPANDVTVNALWELIPCLAAENIAVDNSSLTATSALITWNSNQDNTFGGVYYENGVLVGSNNQLYQRWSLSELQPGTDYRVGVFAYCSLDRVSDTVWVEFTTNDTCYPPVSVSISDVTAHSALLSYDFGEHVPSDFMVLISTDPDFDEYDAVSTSTAPNYFPSSMPLSSLVGLNLQSGTTYYVRMASQCSTYLISVWSETLSFTTLQEYAVTIDANIINGTVTADDTVATAGTVVNLTATPDNGYSFGEWIVTTVNTPAPEIVTVTNNSFVMPASEVNISATFTPNSYNITINQVTGGTITVTVSGATAGTTTNTTADFESWIQLSEVTEDGYTFVDFLVTDEDGEIIETPNNGFTMPASDVTVTATFSVNNYTITYMDGNSILAQDTFAFGATITPMANPTKEGYTFIGWTPALPATMPANDLTVDAQWQINSYDITINQVTGGTITVSFAGESATSFISTTTDTAANFETWIQLSVVTDDGYTFVDFVVTTASGDTLETPNNGFIMPAENVTVTAIFSINNYTITYMDGNSILAQDTFAFGATITPMANPTKEGYTFTGWTPALPATMPANDLTVDAQWQINSYDITINQVTGGTITVSFAGESATSAISTTTDTAANYETWIQLSAAADYAYDFVDFVVTTASGDTLETPNNGFIMPAENVTVTAIFTLHYFNVTVNVSDDTPWGTVTGGGSFVYGSTDTLTATANDQYIFVGWSDFNTENPRVITVTGDSVLTAYFIPEDIEIVSNDTLTGSVNVQIPGGHLSPNSPIVITAVPEPHYHFVSWSDGNTDNPRTLLPIQAVGLTAIFAIDQHTVTVLSNDDNMGMVDGSATVDYGSVIQISATAYTGYMFISWNDGNTENPRYITVECDTTFTATFQLADGIEDANLSNVNVYSYNDQVVIANAEGFSVEIFDMSGRLIVSENNISQSARRYTITTDGIYLVKVGNNLFKKVKIAR